MLLQTNTFGKIVLDTVVYPTGGLTVDRVNDKLYFSYKSGSDYYIAEKEIGGSQDHSNIPGLQRDNEFSAILVNGK